MTNGRNGSRRARAGAVTRHLHYAWIEFGATADARAFTSGLDALGWKSITRYLQRRSDEWGAHYQDPNYPILPIRWRGSSQLILPNAVKDSEKHAWVNDPLLKEAREKFGELKFREMVKEYCSFLGQWVFNPGLKRTSNVNAELSIEPDATHCADLVAIGGHSSAGYVWGGDMDLAAGLTTSFYYDTHDVSSSRLKYVVIAGCCSVRQDSLELLHRMLRRSAPVHGLFGYRDAYPGGSAGGRIYRSFAEGLKANGGTIPILEAYRNAHRGQYQDRWSALIHESARNDTMRDWMSDNLPTPDPAGTLRYYCEDNWPEGEVLMALEPDIVARYEVAGTVVDRNNNHQDGVGLIPGSQGVLRITAKGSPFKAGDTLTCAFIYYRPEKEGLDLDYLLEFPKCETDSWRIVFSTTANVSDGIDKVDGFEIDVYTEASEIEIPFRVHPKAHEYYPPQGADCYGYFWLVLGRCDHRDRIRKYRYYLDGARLRGLQSVPEVTSTPAPNPAAERRNTAPVVSPPRGAPPERLPPVPN